MKLIESEQSELGAERQWALRVPLQPHGEICRSDGTERSAPLRRAKSPAGRLRWHRRDSTAPGQAGEGWWLRAQPHSEGSSVGGESSPRPFLLRGGGAAGRAEGTALLGVLLGQCLRGVWTQRSLESWGQRVPRTLCSAGQGLPGTKLLIFASTLNKWMGKFPLLGAGDALHIYVIVHRWEKRKSAINAHIWWPNLSGSLQSDQANCQPCISFGNLLS